MARRGPSPMTFADDSLCEFLDARLRTRHRRSLSQNFAPFSGACPGLGLVEPCWAMVFGRHGACAYRIG